MYIEIILVASHDGILSKFILVANISFLLQTEDNNVDHQMYPIYWRSSQYTHVRNKKSNTQGSSPNVVKVIYHAIRNYSYRKDFAHSGRNGPSNNMISWSFNMAATWHTRQKPEECSNIYGG